MGNESVSKTTFDRDEYIRMKIYDNVCSIKTQLYVLMKENERSSNPYMKQFNPYITGHRLIMMKEPNFLKKIR